MANFTAGSVLTAADLNTAINTLTVNAQTGTAYTLVATDAGGLLTMNNSSASTVTIPPNSSVAFATGTVVTVIQLGAGQVSIAGGSGVTVHSKDSNLNMDAQYTAVGLYKVGTDTWVAIGDLAP